MKYDFEKIVDRLEFWIDFDEKVDTALKSLSEVFAPSSYPVFIENSPITGFIEAFEIVDSKLADDLNYYVYEVSNMEDKATVIFDGKEWNFKNRNEFIDYLNETYNPMF